MVDTQDDADNQSDLLYAGEEEHWYPTSSMALSSLTEGPIRLRPAGPLEVQQLVREEEEDGNDKEAQESSEGEDIEVFVGLVGQPICPPHAQIDSPLRMVIGYLQAIVSTLISLTPPPNSVATIPMALGTRAQIPTGYIGVIWLGTLESHVDCNHNVFTMCPVGIWALAPSVDWERIVPVPESPHQYTDVGV